MLDFLDLEPKICVSWSGGKNSTYAAYLYDIYGLKVTLCSYIPMFDDDIPLIPKSSYEFLLNTADFFRSKGHTVVFVKGITYFDWCARLLVKGKNKGLPQGFPFFMRNKCGFARDSKIASVNNFFTHNHFDFIDIGLCADEENRKKLKDNEVSILRSMGIEDYECLSLCRNVNLLSPKYLSSSRDGCVLCPNASSIERFRFLEEYPVAREKLLYLQSLSKIRGHYPLRYKKWFIENEDFISGNGSNISIFGEVIN